MEKLKRHLLLIFKTIPAGRLEISSSNQNRHRPRAAANAGMNIDNKNSFTNKFIMEERDTSFM
jgi:hypothetical protein